MRISSLLFMLTILLSSCGDDARVYEQYNDFETRYWLAQDKPQFEFSISDASIKYTLYADVRNSVSYPWSRFFMNYSLQDSTGTELKKDLVSEFLFDAKTGKPFGKSGLGDIYDHEVVLLKDYQFTKAGKYKMSFEQQMRTDTLQGILAVGLRVEKTETK